MTPPCRTFHASDLPRQVQVGPDGKRRKTEDGKPIDLKACELLSLVQYDCQVERPVTPESVTRCYPVQRWFRRYVWLPGVKMDMNGCVGGKLTRSGGNDGRCRDKKGSFMVETTAWEGTTPATPASSATHTKWHDANSTDYSEDP